MIESLASRLGWNPLVYSRQSFQQSIRANQKVLANFTNTLKLLRCGNHVAHCQTGSKATTAGHKPTRQCSFVCTPVGRLASNGVRVSGRIDKKLTKPQGSNRPEGRVPEATSRALYGVPHWRRWFPSPLLRVLALPG